MDLVPELYAQVEKLINRGERKKYNIDIVTKMGTFVLIVDDVMFRCYTFKEIETILALLIDHQDLQEKEKKQYEQTEIEFKKGVISISS